MSNTILGKIHNLQITGCLKKKKRGGFEGTYKSHSVSSLIEEEIKPLAMYMNCITSERKRFGIIKIS